MVGTGIASTTLAYWLKRYGFEPTLVERAEQLRTGRYVIDFLGLGFLLRVFQYFFDSCRNRSQEFFALLDWPGRARYRIWNLTP